MKSVLFGWLLGLGLLASHVGCCSIQLDGGHGCGLSSCGECNECGGGFDHGINVPFGGVRSRIANHISGARCAASCGEVYWDEHINEPPVCDPCGCNGEFTGETCGTCPTALGRLRNLWGYRYHPSNCDSCTSCGSGGVTGVASHSTCSSCSGGSHVEHAPSTTHSHAAEPKRESVPSQPTPAVRPSTEPVAPEAAPAPVPDPSAMRRPSSNERLTIGSGVTASNAPKSVKARSVSTSGARTVQARPKLVTK